MLKGQDFRKHENDCVKKCTYCKMKGVDPEAHQKSQELVCIKRLLGSTVKWGNAMDHRKWIKLLSYIYKTTRKQDANK